MKHLYSVLIVLFFSILFYGSTQVQRLQTTQTIYEKTQRQPYSQVLDYTVPVIAPAPQTEQLQIKGGVTISCEVVPFRADSSRETKRSIAYADPDRPGYDVYEVKSLPTYTVTPAYAEFNITVRNNQDRILKLNDVAIVSIVDGVQYSIPTENLLEWKNALVVKGFEKTYRIRGPQLASLHDAKVIYLSINDVPTEYDPAGTVLRKENFEWYFEISHKEVTKTAQVEYSYEYQPVETRRCASCNGIGYFTQQSVCRSCRGTGVYVSNNGERMKCLTCRGAGKVTTTITCQACQGRGQIEYPKSQLPPVVSSMGWSGWKVNVKTNPPGAKISVVDVKTGEYKPVGVSNMVVDWYSSDVKQYPIRLEYQGKTIEVVPFNKQGNAASAVLVDFTGEPIVKKGKASR